jgi:hypothetical protein
MPSKADCVAAVSRAANVSTEQASAVVDFVLKERQRLKAAGQLANLEGSLARSLVNMAEAERISLAREKRNTALTIVKRQRLAERVTALQGEGLSFGRAITTLLWGDRSRAAGVRESAARRVDALRTLWRGELARELDAIPGLALAIKKDPALDSAIRREMIEPGSTGDATAARAAEVFGRSLEDIRATLNDAGANIGKLQGYAPQNHNAKKLLKAGRQAWVTRMLDALDWERTMVDVPAERRGEVLGELWTSIVTGQKPVAREVSANPFKKPRNVASGFEHERTLHFKDAETAAAYHKDFGEGTVLDAVLSRVERGSRSAGMMEVFGPNPETMIESLFTEERLRLRAMTPDALAVATKEATDKDSNTLREISSARTAVAIRKPRGLGNVWREARKLADAGTKKRLAKLEKGIAKAQADGDGARAAELAKEWEQAVEGLRLDRVNSVGQFRVGDRKGRTGAALKVLMGETGAAETPTGAKIARAMRAVRQVNSSSLLASAAGESSSLADEDGNWLRNRQGKDAAVAIRKREGTANGYRGSAVMAAIGDIQTNALWFRHGGENVFTSVHKAFGMAVEGLQPAEKLELGRALGFYADKMLGDFHSRFSEGDSQLVIGGVSQFASVN